MPTHPPETLSLWDRWFNRYRREVHARGKETWGRTSTYAGVPFGATRDFQRDWIEYRIIDRLTGLERIEREYLN